MSHQSKHSITWNDTKLIERSGLILAGIYDHMFITFHEGVEYKEHGRASFGIHCTIEWFTIEKDFFFTRSFACNVNEYGSLVSDMLIYPLFKGELEKLMRSTKIKKILND